MGRPPLNTKLDTHPDAPIGTRMPKDLLNRIDEWCRSQDPKVSRTSLIISACEKFLAERGTKKRK